MYIFVYLLTLCYFRGFFHIYNVFMIIVVKTPDRPGVKFILIIVYIPYEIVYIHMSQYIIKK